MRVKINVEISDRAPDPEAVVDYLKDILRSNRHIESFRVEAYHARGK